MTNRYYYNDPAVQKRMADLQRRTQPQPTLSAIEARAARLAARRREPKHAKPGPMSVLLARLERSTKERQQATDEELSRGLDLLPVELRQAELEARRRDRAMVSNPYSESEQRLRQLDAEEAERRRQFWADVPADSRYWSVTERQVAETGVYPWMTPMPEVPEGTRVYRVGFRPRPEPE